MIPGESLTCGIEEAGSPTGQNVLTTDTLLHQSALSLRLQTLGIDVGDEWASKNVIARPRLGKMICRRLGLTADEESKRWCNRDGKTVLENQVWGEWKPDPDVRNHRSQDGGAILWGLA